uniref:Uncharacterized protein n=1 Tax=Anas platyrhynchos platyrhynchos TaxID=8840 RepID=A0A493TKQ4_ANAPP
MLCTSPSSICSTYQQHPDGCAGLDATQGREGPEGSRTHQESPQLGVGAGRSAPALSRSRDAVPAVGQLPVLRHARRALRLPRAPLHGHRAAQRAHDLGRLPRGQVRRGPLAAPRLDPAALLRPHPQHRHHDPGADFHPKGNTWPCPMPYTTSPLVRGSGTRGGGSPGFRGPSASSPLAPSSCTPARRCGRRSRPRFTRTSWTCGARAPASTAASPPPGASAVSTPMTFGWVAHSGPSFDASYAAPRREELKKLYAQLEVLKTRRMAANNPHLPKKRGSRRSLGRSLVRRLAELPEAMAPRGSREERLRTPGSRRASAKRLPSTGSASLRARDGGFRHHAAALRKSRSSETPAWDPQGGSPDHSPSGDTAPGTPVVPTAGSGQSDSESLDAAPLVCKSASAHDLSGHQQPPQPRAALLLKSLSVVAGARDEALLVASRAARDGRDAEWGAEHRTTQRPATGRPTEQAPPEQAAAATGMDDAPLPAGSGRADGGPSRDASPPGDGKAQKHVTYAPTKSSSVDGSHLSGRVRVAVRKTPPPPPMRYQSLVHHAGDSRETAEPPEPPEGTPGRAPPPAGQGRLQSARSIPAEVCPWELIQEEILSRKQKAAEPSASGPPGDTPVAPPSLKPPSQKTFKSLGLAIKALNRSRGKNSLKGKKESEGSLRKKGRDGDGGSSRERPKLAGTPTFSPGGSSQGPTNGSPKPSPQEGDAVPWQHNNNAGSTSESAACGGSGGQAEGQEDGTATDGGGGGEEPGAAPGSTDTGRVPETPSGTHEVSPSSSRGDTSEHPQQTPAPPPAPPVPPAPPAPPPLPPPLELGTGSPQVPGHSAAAAGPRAEVCPWEALGAPPGALALQEATAAGGGSPKKVLGKGGSQPGPRSAREGCGTEGLPARSRSTEVARAGGGLRTEICPWEGSGGEAGPPHGGPGSVGPGAELGEKPPELPAAAPGTVGSGGGRTAEVCPWESAEGGPAPRAEICPWEVGEPQPEKGKVQQDGGRLPRGGSSIRPRSLGLLRAQDGGGQAASSQPALGQRQHRAAPP